jgi:Integrase core domain
MLVAAEVSAVVVAPQAAAPPAVAPLAVATPVLPLCLSPPALAVLHIRRRRRGKSAKPCAPGHTLCVDIGFGDGVSPGGHRFCLVIVDAGSRQCWCYGLRDTSGSSIAKAFLQLFADIGPERTAGIRRILTDFDTKIIRGDSRRLLISKHIRIHSSVPYRHSQNGLVERHWGTAVGMARAYLQEANLPKRFWFWA